MKITRKTHLHYSYFDGTRIKINNKIYFYFEKSSVLDKYQIIEAETDRVLACAENKEELLDYLISQSAEVVD